MNVLIISHMYPSAFNHMSGIFVHKQVEELVRQGCNVKVISAIPWAGFPLNKLSEKWNLYSKIPSENVIDNIPTFHPRYIEFPRGYFLNSSGKRMYKSMKNLIHSLNNENKFDLIHSHVALPDGYAGMLLSEELKLPHVVTVHGQDFQNTIKRSNTLKNTVFDVLNKSDKVITVSNKLKRMVDNETFFNKIHVVNNGIDINDCIRESNNNIQMQEPNILSVSNLIKTKGIDLNIEAIKILVKKYKNLKYYIIGDGPEKENLLNLVKEYNLQDNIIFLGKLKHDEVMNYMNKCTIFSLPSWQEGFGVVYIEAMLQCKPVIGVKGEGIEDVIEHNYNGILVSPKNIDEIVNVIDRLLDDKEKRISIGNKAKDTVINNFTWKINAQKVIKLYEELIEHRR